MRAAHFVFSRSFLVRSVACWPPLEVLCSAASSCFSFSVSSRCFCLRSRFQSRSVRKDAKRSALGAASQELDG